MYYVNRLIKLNNIITNQYKNIQKIIGPYNEKTDKYFYILKISNKIENNKSFIKLGITNNYLEMTIKNVVKKYYNYNDLDILIVAKCNKPLYFKQYFGNKFYKFRINNISRDCYIYSEELKKEIKNELLKINNIDSLYIHE